MSGVSAESEDLVSEIEALGEMLAKAKSSITRRFIGQARVVDLTLAALLCGGHGLLIGLPGLVLSGAPSVAMLLGLGCAWLLWCSPGVAPRTRALMVMTMVTPTAPASTRPMPSR